MLLLNEFKYGHQEGRGNRPEDPRRGAGAVSRSGVRADYDARHRGARGRRNGRGVLLFPLKRRDRAGVLRTLLHGHAAADRGGAGTREGAGGESARSDSSEARILRAQPGGAARAAEERRGSAASDFAVQRGDESHPRYRPGVVRRSHRSGRRACAARSGSRAARSALDVSDGGDLLLGDRRIAAPGEGGTATGALAKGGGEAGGPG